MANSRLTIRHAGKTPGFSNRRPRHYLAYLIVGTSFMVACNRDAPGPRGSAPPAGSRIVVIGPPGDNPAWPGTRGGARRFAEKLSNISVETLVPENATEQAYRDLLERVLEKPPVAICLYVPDLARAAAATNSGEPNDNASTDEPRAATTADPFDGLTRKVVDRGVLLVTIGREMPPGRAFGHVGVDWAGGAQLLGRNLKNIAPDKASYVLLHERGLSRIGADCYERFSNAATRERVMTRLTEREADHGPPRQREQLREMLAQFSSAGLVITLTAEPWFDIPPERWLDPRNSFATLSAAPRLWPRLASGEAAALVGPLDGDVGYGAVELAWLGLTGAERAGTRPMVPCELVTPQTRTEFARRYAESAGASVESLLIGEGG